MMSTWMRLAAKVAMRSTHVQHRLGAVVVRGGVLLGAAANLGRWGRCAERRALRPHMDANGATIYVYRLGGGVSKPCPNCQEAIRKAGIAKVVYVDEGGQIGVGSF